ncbi:hypothetical protein [Aeoliella sp. SH292]|uniref:hypothetical protein n=1 Tax=Aeoliella sp. SH292 TaxID=3454464 RepID=UPI003F9E0E69
MGTIRSILVALVVGIMPTAGCMKDIPYDATAENSASESPAAEGQPAGSNVPIPEAEPGEVDLFANVPTKEETPPAAPPETEPANESDPAPEPIAPPSESPKQTEEEFFDSVFGPRSTDKPAETTPEPEPKPEPEAETPRTPEPLPATGLPPGTPVLEVKPMELPSVAPAKEKTEEPLLPWLVTEEEKPVETPAASPANPPVETPATDTEPLPVAEPETREELPAVASAAPLPFEAEPPKTAPIETKPIEPKPIDSRDLTWRLASRLSYLLLAPDSDVASVRQELEPVAAVLALEVPNFTVTEVGSPEQLKQLLAVGRAMGEEASEKYGPKHAALVEIAFKSNLLLAVAEERPQLRHGINGSVSAAAVRAGLPEVVWKPFQDEVAAHDDAASLTEAVLRLHNDVGKYFEDLPVADPQSEPPVLR